MLRNVNIKAIKIDNNYYLPINISGNHFNIKFDVGANNTVISLDYFSEMEKTKEGKQKILNYLDSHDFSKTKFVSASGADFYGYLVHANNVTVGDELFVDFYYYLVIQNNRIIALLGEDFLDNCEYHHLPHGDIEITNFDEESYKDKRSSAISQEDLLNAIDEIELGG